MRTTTVLAVVLATFVGACQPRSDQAAATVEVALDGVVDRDVTLVRTQQRTLFEFATTLDSAWTDGYGEVEVFGDKVVLKTPRDHGSGALHVALGGGAFLHTFFYAHRQINTPVYVVRFDSALSKAVVMPGAP